MRGFLRFSGAIELSPRKVGPRIGLALCFSTEGQLEEAIRELKIAQTLHPQGTQAGNILRMLERQQGANDAQARP